MLKQQPCSDGVYGNNNSHENSDTILPTISFPIFLSRFSFLVRKPGGLGRKSAQKQHLCNQSWGESKDCAKQGTAKERKSEQV